MKNILKSVGYLVYYVAFQLLIQFGFSAFAVLSGIVPQDKIAEWMMNNLLLFTILSNLLSVLGLALFFKIRKKKLSKEVVLKKVGFSNYILPIVTAVSFSMFFSLITYNFTFENSALSSQSAVYYSQMAPWLGGTMMIIQFLFLAPLTEEIIFRGLIITRVERSFSSTAAVIASSLLFGAMHVMAGGIVLVIGAAFMGGIFGIIFVKTRSLLPAFAAHIFANSLEFILPNLPAMHSAVYIASGVVFLLISIVCLILLCRKKAVYTI